MTENLNQQREKQLRTMKCDYIYYLAMNISYYNRELIMSAGVKTFSLAP